MQDTEIVKDVLDESPEAVNKKKNRQTGSHQAKKPLRCKGTINKVKSQQTKWEKVLENYTAEKCSISKISKGRKKSRNRSISAKKWAKDINRHFSNRPMKACSITWVPGKQKEK